MGCARRRAGALLIAMLLVGSGVATATSPAGAQVGPGVFTETTGPTVAVSGTYTPIVGDFVGNSDLDDILWYAPGAGQESLWSGSSVPEAPFGRAAVPQLTGTYQPVVGDFTGDGLDDIIWYGPGTAPDLMWRSSFSGFQSVSISISGTFTPIVLTNVGRPDSVFWYAPGSATDWLWTFALGGARTSAAYQVNGTFKPFSGDFDGNRLGDIFWYAPATAPDSRWLRKNASAAASFTSNAESVSGRYTPVVGQFLEPIGAYSRVKEDIVWATASGQDWLWETAFPGWAKRPVDLGGQRVVRLLDQFGDGIVTVNSGGADQLWRGSTIGGGTNQRIDLSPVAADARPVVGRFADSTQEAVLWYVPGSGAERLWTYYTAP